MPQYLVAIHHPDNYDRSAEGEEMESHGRKAVMGCRASVEVREFLVRPTE